MLPVRNGIGPSCVGLPAGPWPSLLAFLVQRFPAISADAWVQRMARGDVVDEAGQARAEAVHIARISGRIDRGVAAAMEGAGETDDVDLFRMAVRAVILARHLQRPLDRLGAGIGEEDVVEALGRDDGLPRVDVHALHAGFGECGHIRQGLQTRGAPVSQCPQLARFDMLQDRGRARSHGVDLPAQQVGHRRRWPHQARGAGDRRAPLALGAAPRVVLYRYKYIPLGNAFRPQDPRRAR